MSLVSCYHDGTNPTTFNVDFTETMMIPRNARLRLLKAVVPHAKGLTFAAVDALDLTINDYTATPLVINLASTGSKTIQEVANELTAAGTAALAAAGVDNCVFLCRYVPSLGHGPGCFVVDCRLTSTYFNNDREVDFSVAPWLPASFVDAEKEDALLNTAAFTATNTSIGATDLQDTGPAATTSWANAIVLGSVDDADPSPLAYWFKTTRDTTLSQPPDANDRYAALSWTCQHGGLNGGGAQQSWWVGLTHDATISIPGGVTANVDIAEITNLDEVEVVVFVCGAAYTASNPPTNTGTKAFIKGGMYVYERQADGTLKQTHEYATTGVEEVDNNDEIGLTWVAQQPVSLHIRKAGETGWRNVLPIPGASRGSIPEGDMFACAGFFDAAASTAEADLQLDAITGSFSADVRVAEYGEYIKMDFNGTFADDMGISILEHETESDALSVANDKDIVITETTEDCPAVNVNIRNLPIRSYTNQNTIRTGLSSSSTIGCLSRYDMDGNLSANQSLVLVDGATDVALNNGEEIALSQLQFELRDVTGKIPTDLTTPQWYMLSISPQGH